MFTVKGGRFVSKLHFVPLVVVSALAAVPGQRVATAPARAEVKASITPLAVPIRVLTAPQDVTTNTGSAVMTVAFDVAPASSVATQVEGSIQVRTYPDLAPVAFTTAARVTSLDGRPTSGDPLEIVRRYIDVTPVVPAGSPWLLLSISTLPTGLVSGSAVDNPQSSLGAQIERIHTKSSPVVRQVRLIETGRFEVLFSESLPFDATVVGQEIQVQNADSTPCALVPLPTSTTGYPVVSFDCSTASWTAQKVHLQIGDGLKGVGGAPLGLLRTKGCASSPLSGTFSSDLDFSSAHSCSMGCKQLSLVEPDTTPPTLNVSVAPGCLWPPNHKMVLYSSAGGLSVSATDECDPSPAVQIIKVTSNQPNTGGGSGNTSPDEVWGNQAFCVRSEREGTVLSPREYTIEVVATDVSGNSIAAQATVSVPHSGPCMNPEPAGRVVADGDPRCSQ